MEPILGQSYRQLSLEQSDRVGNLGAPEEFDDLLGHHLHKELAKAWTVGAWSVLGH